jgi:hypothetical protein
MCESIWLAGKEFPQLLGHATTRHSHSFSTWVRKYRRWTDLPQEGLFGQAWSSYGQSWIWLFSEPLVMISEHPLLALRHAHSTNKHSFKWLSKLPNFPVQTHAESFSRHVEHLTREASTICLTRILGVSWSIVVGQLNMHFEWAWTHG